jgi:predicted ATPase
MLYLYQERHRGAYERIRDALRLMFPLFDDFVLAPDRHATEMVRLNWRQRDSEYLFGGHQMSDGTLRAATLLTALLAPEEDQAKVLLLDEPELGLHPYAQSLIAGMIRAAATERQLIVTTQSPTFLAQFAPEDVMVVENGPKGSSYRRLDAASLQHWLEDENLGQLWETNVLGGGPMA